MFPLHPKSWTATTTDDRHGSTSSRQAHNCGQNSYRSCDGRTFERSFLSRELFPSLKDLRVSQGVRCFLSQNMGKSKVGADAGYRQAQGQMKL